MISIVCTCNNRTILHTLPPGWTHKNNTVNYELIVVEDKKTDFKSASEALNYGESKSH